jgi:hypothetical protein
MNCAPTDLHRLSPRRMETLLIIVPKYTIIFHLNKWASEQHTTAQSIIMLSAEQCHAERSEASLPPSRETFDALRACPERSERGDKGTLSC